LRLALSALIALAPLAALAECPVAADLETGIRLSDGEGSETFVRDSDLSVIATYEAEGAPPTQSLLAHGIYVMSNADLEDGTPVSGTEVTYVYPVNVPDLPLPIPGGTFETTVMRLGDGQMSNQRETYAFGEMTSVTIGACSFEMIPITARYPDEGPDRYEVIHYLPELGFGYLAEYHDAQMDDIYTYTAIEAVQ
jgi:hypothetical protein